MGVFTRGNSPWYWLYLERPGGRGIKERTLIRHDAVTAEERRRLRQLAEAAYRVRMSELARGTYELPGARPPIAFSAFADWYETNVSAHLAGQSREAEMLKQLRAHFGTVPLAELTRARVREWMTTRQAGVAVGTVNRELDLLKSLLREAVPQYLAASPLVGLRRLGAKRAGGTTEDDDQVRTSTAWLGSAPCWP
jgi:hypothetical protein